jgi:hypothetical protein
VDPTVPFFEQPGAPRAYRKRGTWNATTAYLVNDIVHRPSSGNKSYACLIANTGQDPSSAPTYWALWVL